MEIFQVKTKERLTAELSYVHIYPKDAENEDPREDKVTGHACRHLMHDDFLVALDNLRIFLADLAEYHKYKTMEKDPELLIPFEVTGVTVGDTDENKGVTIIGRRNLNENRVLSLVSPFVKYDPDTSYYPKATDLEVAVDTVMHEAKLYMEGKKRPTAQLELFNGEDGDLAGVTMSVVNDDESGAG